MSQPEKDQLLAQIKIIESRLAAVKKQLEGLAISGVTYKVREDVSNQETYVSGMKDLLNSNCQKTVSLKDAVLQTNLNNNRWVLGNLTMQQLIQEYSERSMQYQYVNNCPSNAPFYVENKGCLAC